MIAAYAKPFEAPTKDQILKFKSHTYLGEGHPVEKKAVLSVKVADLGLNETEKHKFLLLSGPRYNVNTEELVMSSEKFPHRKQNKKFLIDTLQKLIKEAKVSKRTVCMCVCDIDGAHLDDRTPRILLPIFLSIYQSPSKD